jgi:hypothetical protein
MDSEERANLLNLLGGFYKEYFEKEDADIKLLPENSQNIFVKLTEWYTDVMRLKTWKFPELTDMEKAYTSCDWLCNSINRQSNLNEITPLINYIAYFNFVDLFNFVKPLNFRESRGSKIYKVDNGDFGYYNALNTAIKRKNKEIFDLIKSVGAMHIDTMPDVCMSGLLYSITTRDLNGIKFVCDLSEENKVDLFALERNKKMITCSVLLTNNIDIIEFMFAQLKKIDEKYISGINDFTSFDLVSLDVVKYLHEKYDVLPLLHHKSASLEVTKYIIQQKRYQDSAVLLHGIYLNVFKKYGESAVIELFNLNKYVGWIDTLIRNYHIGDRMFSKELKDSLLETALRHFVGYKYNFANSAKCNNSIDSLNILNLLLKYNALTDVYSTIICYTNYNINIPDFVYDGFENYKYTEDDIKKIENYMHNTYSIFSNCPSIFIKLFSKIGINFEIPDFVCNDTNFIKFAIENEIKMDHSLFFKTACEMGNLKSAILLYNTKNIQKDLIKQMTIILEYDILDTNKNLDPSVEKIEVLMWLRSITD